MKNNRSIVICWLFAMFLLCGFPLSSWADDHSDIVNTYREFNTQLFEMGFREADRKFASNATEDAMAQLKSIDTHPLLRFYSTGKIKAVHECKKISYCEDAELIFLGVMAFEKYTLKLVELKQDGYARTSIRGISGSGDPIKLGVIWVKENQSWKIDKIIKLLNNKK